jgi:hypothetical protein
LLRGERPAKYKRDQNAFQEFHDDSSSVGCVLWIPKILHPRGDDQITGW